MHLPPEHDGFFHGPGDDARIAAGCFAGKSRIVMHADLNECCSLATEFCHDFRVDQRARRRKLERSEHIATENFESTVDVAHMNAEKDTNREIKDFGEKLAMKFIVSLHAESRDDIELVDER